MQTIIIEENDTIEQITKKLYNDFSLHQSFSIRGLSQSGDKIIDRGEELIHQLKLLDRRNNWMKDKSGKERIKRKPLKNSIGGPQANKMFQYKIEIRDNIKITTIWRIQ